MFSLECRCTSSFNLEGGAFCSPLWGSPCWCPLGPVTLYQVVAAAASLAVVCTSFPPVSGSTFSIGCLGNGPRLLQGEEGPIGQPASQ